MAVGVAVDDGLRVLMRGTQTDDVVIGEEVPSKATEPVLLVGLQRPEGAGVVDLKMVSHDLVMNAARNSSTTRRRSSASQLKASRWHLGPIRPGHR